MDKDEMIKPYKQEHKRGNIEKGKKLKKKGSQKKGRQEKTKKN